MAEIRLFGRAPLRSLLLEEVTCNMWCVALYGVKSAGLTLPEHFGRLRPFDVVLKDAVSHHRATGLPITRQDIGEGVTSCRQGERW